MTCGTNNKRKILPPTVYLDWIRSPNKSAKKGTIIWKAIINSFHIIGDWLIWKIGDDSKVLIGKDPWIGCANNHLLPEELVISLNQRGFFYLNQIGHRNFITGNTRWISGEDLNLEANSLQA
jgi:hypothetical protein